MILGRTDLRKGVSEAKFDVESDFDVKTSLLARSKSIKNHEKPKKTKKTRKTFYEKKLSVEKSKVANRLKRVFPKFRADRRQVRGANERSKFEFLWSNTFFYGRIRFFMVEYVLFFFRSKTSNGRKIVRIAPIWTKI